MNNKGYKLTIKIIPYKELQKLIDKHPLIRAIVKDRMNYILKPRSLD